MSTLLFLSPVPKIYLLPLRYFLNLIFSPPHYIPLFILLFPLLDGRGQKVRVKKISPSPYPSPAIGGEGKRKIKTGKIKILYLFLILCLYHMDVLFFLFHLQGLLSQLFFLLYIFRSIQVQYFLAFLPLF